jgi:hypothetical protein
MSESECSYLCIPACCSSVYRLLFQGIIKQGEWKQRGHQKKIYSLCLPRSMCQLDTPRR